MKNYRKEKNRKKIKHNLKERVKKLECLQEILNLIKKSNISLEGMIKGTLDLIPLAWQFPEVIAARIIYDQEEYKTDNLKKTQWKLSTNFKVSEKVVNIEVYYLEEKSFFKEEKNLINEIAECLKNMLERKLAEQELREAYDRIDFYKNLLAHNMGNILSNIKMTAHLCEMWMDNPEKLNKTKELMKIIYCQVDRGALLISNVRELSIVDESEIVVKSIDVKNMLKAAIEQVRNRFHERGINIEVKSSQKNFRVKGGIFLIDAFENILINGATHNESDTIKLSVIISKTQQNGCKFVKIEFKDNGIGIADDLKRIIFERDFKRYNNRSGMGIGLSLVKKIINIYDGKVWVEDQGKDDHSKGSNFIVLLPE